MKGTNVQGKKFPSPGRCIYCGSDGGKGGLHKEHIVPLSLGGTAYIEKASCTDCGSETSYIDGYLADHVFPYLRAYIGIKRRRRKKKVIPLTANLIVAGQETTKEFGRIGDYPFIVALPFMQPPGILLGDQPSESFGLVTAHSYSVIFHNLGQTMNVPPGERIGVRGTGDLNFETFGRAIAKIAYCNACAEYTLARFRPLAIPDLILGKYACVSYFVGQEDRDPPPPGPSNLLHPVDCQVVPFGRQRLILCSVRLFANCGTDKNGMPIYLVVVGAPKF